MTFLSSQKAGVEKTSQLTRSSFVLSLKLKTVAIVFDQLHQIND